MSIDVRWGSGNGFTDLTGEALATLTATLSAVTSLPVTVDLGYTGTAISGTDYTPSTQITIAAGSISGTATVLAIDDVLDDPDETVIADITDVTNATEEGTQQVTVTIVDDDKGTIVIVKDTVPDGAQDFAFTTTGGLTPSTFDLDDDTDDTLSNTQTYTDVSPRGYTVSEIGVPGFTTIVSCTDPDDGTTTSGATASIDLDAGETVTCTFTNTKFDDVQLTKIGCRKGDAEKVDAEKVSGTFS